MFLSMVEEDGGPGAELHCGEQSRAGVARWWNRHGAVVLAALVAAAAALGGNAIGASGAYNAAVAQQEAGAAAAAEREVRTKRGEVYAAYLGAANQYVIENSKMIRELESSEANPDNLNPAVLNSWLSARSDYQGEINRVYVYGSDRAWELHRDLAAALPPALGSEIEFKKVNDHAFTTAYQEFQKVVCLEVPAIPRRGC